MMNAVICSLLMVGPRAYAPHALRVQSRTLAQAMVVAADRGKIYDRVSASIQPL